MDEFIDDRYIYAVVGATANLQKHGYRVFHSLADKGYEVYPVNPHYEEIDGVSCVPDLIELEERPDVVVLILGEENAKAVVQECIDLGLERLWFQPGSEYDEAVKMAEGADMHVMVGKNILDEA
jgi:predicted CoA-binding protein